MAFLDNSGDIILDAVLTETGRRRMAQGNFRIVKFALGDDEIDYSLYNLNHPSGSAYYDLEILQTPVFEAKLSLNSSLLSIQNNNVLYMPTLLLNDGKVNTAVQTKNTTVYLSVNTETQLALNNATLGFGDGYTVLSGQRGGSKLIAVESGINNSTISMTSTNQSTYITSQNMLDTNGAVVYDNNFIATVLSSPTNTRFATSADGSWNGTTVPLQARTAVSPSDKTGFNSVNIPLSRASIFTNTTATTDATSFVQSEGVVGSMAYLNMTVDPALTTTMTQTADTRWTKFGQTGTTITGLSATRTFSIIETSMEVSGLSSGATLNIPITLIKRDT